MKPAKNNSLFRRHFVVTASMILLAFTILGAGFMYLSYRYTVQEKKQNLEEVGEYVSKLTSQMVDGTNQLKDEDYLACLSIISGIAGNDLILCQPDGTVQYLYNGDNQTDTKLTGKKVDERTLQKVIQDKRYSGTTDLGVYAKAKFVVGMPLYLSDGQTLGGAAFLTSDMSRLTGLWRDQAMIYLATAIVVLCPAFLSCTFAGIQQLKPLKESADIGRRFGMGEYDLRIGDRGRHDELDELANAFDSMADSIAETESRRQELVSNLSHELKTPMTTISGFADGILDGTIPPDRQENALRVISSETRRMNRLVRRILDSSRIQDQYQSTNSCQLRFDIVETMARVMISLEGRINSHGLDIDVQFPDTPTIVWGDPDSVTQVCYNLLDNAIKFSTRGTAIRLSIQTKGRKAYVSVRNMGETIPPEELDKIFDRFHKSDRSRSLDKEGVGLGLYIVKTILNSLKETITVTSENGVTEFTFTLTLAE